LTTEELAEVNNINQNDLRALLEEESALARENHKFYFLPWINDRKIVFESAY